MSILSYGAVEDNETFCFSSSGGNTAGTIFGVHFERSLTLAKHEQRIFGALLLTSRKEIVMNATMNKFTIFKKRPKLSRKKAKNLPIKKKKTKTNEILLPNNQSKTLHT